MAYTSRFYGKFKNPKKICEPRIRSFEMYRHQSYNHKVDIFALGVALYEITNRKTPFVIDLNKNHLNNYFLKEEEIKELRDKMEPVNPKYSKNLQDLINSMLNQK